MTGGVVATTTGADARLAPPLPLRTPGRMTCCWCSRLLKPRTVRRASARAQSAIQPFRPRAGVGGIDRRTQLSRRHGHLVPDGVIRTEAACLLDLIRVP